MTENKNKLSDALSCHPTSDIRHLKRDLRGIMRARRTEAYVKNPLAPMALRDQFLASINVPTNSIIAGYVAMDEEMNVLPLLQALDAKGHKLCLPVLGDAGTALSFRAYKPGDKLLPGKRLALPEPDESTAVVEPDVILVPLLAFDLKGHRLGQGGGYYDRTLNAMRKQRKILAIGIAFACQQIDEIAADSHDEKLDKIVTEIGALIL